MQEIIRHLQWIREHLIWIACRIKDPLQPNDVELILEALAATGQKLNDVEELVRQAL